MIEHTLGKFSAYLRRRLNTFKKSVLKRYNKFRWLTTQAAVPKPVVYNEHFKRYALAIFEASQLKPSLKSGYIKRRAERLHSEHLGVRAIAFYLPQFHPIAENDLWWGKGFTEWSNVTRAVPQFTGHYQPRLPGDLGFYDLRVPEVMRQQVELAKDYGIDGFCFHHYWFNGRRLLEKPVQQFLADPTLDINFCLCWANENWSRRWDGSEHEILMPQSHSPEDDLAFIEDLMPAFKDARYICVDGKPVLIVYRATLFPDIAATAARWRARAREHGFDDLYLVAALSFDVGNPKLFGFDAAVEFPPHQIQSLPITYKHEIINPDFKGQIFDFAEMAGRMGKVDPADYLCHKTVMPSWDNCARKLAAANSFVNDSPAAYAGWLDDALTVTLRRPPKERLIFINAWNEWGEGACLEPDRRYGYANLNATANVLARSYLDEEADALIAEINGRFRKTSKVAILLHLYYQDLLPDLVQKYFSTISGADFFVSVRNDVSINVLEEIAGALPNVYIVKIENRGRDIQPFLRVLEWLVFFDYEIACKLHTKKSEHREDGNFWRDQLLDTLLGGADAVGSIKQIFDNEPKTGVLAPAKSIHNLAVPDLHIDNTVWLDKLLTKMRLERHIGTYAFEFSAGSMFWFRVDALRTLHEMKLAVGDFEHEAGQLDGTLAHALERLMLLCASERGYSAREIDMALGGKAGDATQSARTPVPQINTR